MNDLIATYTSLPNLHPALVHFPIALLPAALLFDLAGFVRRRAAWWGHAATVLYVLAAAGAGAAYRAGRWAEDSLGQIPVSAQGAVAEHADLGLYTLWALGGLAAFRAAVAWRERRRGAPGRSLRGMALVAAAATLGLLIETADHGGALVYRHGLAVARVAGGTAPAKAASPESPGEHAGHAPTGRPYEDGRGALSWRPRAGDESALGDVLASAPGSSLDAVGVEDGAEGSEGLSLRVAGKALLVLAEPFASVEVQARLDTSAFEGTAGLAHHVTDAENAGLLQVSTDGRAALIDLRRGSRHVLGESSIESPRGPFDLAVAVAGRHLKGTLDGATVVHGHVEPPAPGKVGLYFEGRGVVRLLSFQATPIEGD